MGGKITVIAIGLLLSNNKSLIAVTNNLWPKLEIMHDLVIKGGESGKITRVFEACSRLSD